VLLAQHRVASSLKQPNEFVFIPRTGGPLRQRNVGRALRIAQRDALTDDGTPTFPILHRKNERGEPVPVAHGDLRRCTASHELAE